MKVLNSSKVLDGITDLRKLSHMEETIFYVTSELSWHCTDTGFSGVRLLEVVVQRLAEFHDLPSQVSPVPTCPVVNTHTVSSTSNQKSPLW